MRLILVFIAIGSLHLSYAQQGIMDEMKLTEEKLAASTKQFNQFIRRFNGEEDEKGNRYYETDKKYRDAALRKKYIPALVDQQRVSISEATFEEFFSYVINKKDPIYLDFHDRHWFAEVSTSFLFNGREMPLVLYMKVQSQGKGYEWVINDIAFEPFKMMFEKDTTLAKPFIHPMSHEVEFMNLRKAFQDKFRPESYTVNGFEPDLLTLFLYEIKKGALQFKTVTGLKFHFFSVEGWYIEVSNFNRPGYNTGWLISNLVKVSPDQEKLLKNYIYDKR